MVCLQNMMTSQGETILDWPDLRCYYSEFITHHNSQEENSHVKDYSLIAMSIILDPHCLNCSIKTDSSSRELKLGKLMLISQIYISSSIS